MGFLDNLFKCDCSVFEKKRRRYNIIEDFLKERYPLDSVVSVLGTKATVVGHSTFIPFDYSPCDVPVLRVIVHGTLDEKHIKLPELHIMDDVSKGELETIFKEIDERCAKEEK